MLLITNCLLDGDTGRTMDRGAKSEPVRFGSDQRRPSASRHFCKYDNAKLSELPPEDFKENLVQAPQRQVLLYLCGIGPPGDGNGEIAERNRRITELFEVTERLQKQSEDKAEGLVQVVPVIWSRLEEDSPDRRADAAQAAAVNGLVDLLRDIAEWRDEQDIANRKRINVFAHACDASALRRALLQWAQRRNVYGVFRSIFLVAADVDNETLEAGHIGRCFSDAARNVVVYYANDDWRLPIEEPKRCLGHTGPADMSKVAKNVYAVDCDDFNNLIHFPDGHKYFLDWYENGGLRDAPSPVWTHMLHAMKTGRVDAHPDTRTCSLNTSQQRD